MSDQLIMYDVVCHTETCRFFEKIVIVHSTPTTAFLCGPCGEMIYDWKISGT
jgi:hypothetical protein